MDGKEDLPLAWCLTCARACVGWEGVEMHAAVLGGTEHHGVALESCPSVSRQGRAQQGFLAVELGTSSFNPYPREEMSYKIRRGCFLQTGGPSASPAGGGCVRPL